MRSIPFSTTNIDTAALDLLLRQTFTVKYFGLSTYGPDRAGTLHFDNTATDDDLTSAESIAAKFGQVLITADKVSLTADGKDTATVTVTAEGYDTITVSINGVSTVATLTGGSVVYTLVANTPGPITITAPTAIPLVIQAS